MQYIEVGGDDFELEGANASAEEEAEGTDSTTEKVIDIVHAFKLQSMGTRWYTTPVTLIVQSTPRRST